MPPATNTVSFVSFWLFASRYRCSHTNYIIFMLFSIHFFLFFFLILVLRRFFSSMMDPPTLFSHSHSRALSLPFNKLIRPHEYGSVSCAPGHFVSHCSRCESFYLWHGKAKKPQRQIVVRTRRHSIINIKYNVPYYPCHMYEHEGIAK